ARIALTLRECRYRRVVLSPRVVEVEAREPYKLWVRFDDGVASVVDLSDKDAVDLERDAALANPLTAATAATAARTAPRQRVGQPHDRMAGLRRG
ncbi:MAG: hypothetical protein OXG91_03810, partial [bacterium]|nr:hypothetical protein [bacterium]